MKRTAASRLVIATAFISSLTACGDDVGNTAPVDAAPSVDAPTADARVVQPEIAAVIGARCTPGNRSVLVSVAAQGTRRDVSVSFFDKASPLFGDPFLSDASCAFHKFNPTAPCPPCETGDICAMNGVCVAEPKPAQDGELIVRSGGEEQRFVVDPMLGNVYGEVTLVGDQLAMELTGLGQTITLSELSVPGNLEGTSGTITGGLDSPQAVDISWTDPVDSTQVFTHIPVNHHASGPTFTECAVESSATSFHVDGAMLQPLSVITGLEFQGIEHLRFAAADTDIGCVEFRLLRREFVNLGKTR